MATKKKTLKSKAKVRKLTPSIRDMEKRVSKKTPTIVLKTSPEFLMGWGEYTDKNRKVTPKIKNSVIGAVGKNGQIERVSDKNGVVGEAKLTVNKPKLTVNKPKKVKRKKQDNLWWTKF